LDPFPEHADPQSKGTAGGGRGEWDTDFLSEDDGFPAINPLAEYTEPNSPWLDAAAAAAPDDDHDDHHLHVSYLAGCGDCDDDTGRGGGRGDGGGTQLFPYDVDDDVVGGGDFGDDEQQRQHNHHHHFDGGWSRGCATAMVCSPVTFGTVR
jgi:hypothetical protein